MQTKRRKRSRPDANLPEEKTAASAPNLPSKAVLDALPEAVRTAVVEAASFSGPIPPPSMYGEYDRVLPGSADRIFSMAEKEQDHRIVSEQTALRASVQNSKLGQWFGFAIAVICIGAGAFLAMEGQTVAACIALGASAVGLVGRFLETR